MVDVKAIRREMGLTGEAVCREVGISPSGLSMIESGKRHPSVELAKRIASFLGFDWTLFYEENCNPDTANMLPFVQTAGNKGIVVSNGDVEHGP